MNDDNTLNRTSGEEIINPADLNALEEALKLKDKTAAEVIVCSMGPKSAEKLLSRTAAMGADKLYLLTDRRFAGSDTFATAGVLTAFLKKIGDVDLVLCGRRSIDGETAQVGAELAALCGYPLAVNSTAIELADGVMICESLYEHYTQKVALPLPAVVTCYNSINSPRMPSIRGLRAAENIQVQTYSMEDFELYEDGCGLRGSPTRVVKITRNVVRLRASRKLSISDGVAETLELLAADLSGAANV